MLHFELAGDFDRHRRALEVLLVGSQEQDQDVGEKKGKQRLLIEARMGIKEEVIELQCLDQGMKAIGEQVDLIAFPQDARTLSQLDAAGGEGERASTCSRRAQPGRCILRRLVSTAAALESVV